MGVARNSMPGSWVSGVERGLACTQTWQAEASGRSQMATAHSQPFALVFKRRSLSRFFPGGPQRGCLVAFF